MPPKLNELSELQRRLVQMVRENPRDVAKRAVIQLGVTRQAVNYQLRRLVQWGFLTAEGQTRKRAYALGTLANNVARLPVTEQFCPSLSTVTVIHHRQEKDWLIVSLALSEGEKLVSRSQAKRILARL